MPKKTFFNLSEEKRGSIVEALVNEFEAYPIDNSNIKRIVEQLNISRGSFYQYFDSLLEAYFYILEIKLNKIHEAFFELLQRYDKDLIFALNEYAKVIIFEIYNNSNYSLYKNRYLYWNANLEKEWRKYLLKSKENYHTNDALKNSEEIKFIAACIHSLIQRLFLENWSEELFLKHYKQYILWIKGAFGL